MRRSSWMLAAFCFSAPFLVFGLLSIPGCGQAKNDGEGTNLPTNNIPGKETAKKKDAPPADLKPALEGWKKPAAVLVLSGEQHGYLEPCGCSETQSGGVSRRADLFRQIREKGWPVTGLDLGGLSKRDRAQSRIKYDVMRAALIDMGYALQGLGPDELKLDPDHLVSQVADSTAEDAPLPMVAANVSFYGADDFPTPARFRLVKVGDVTFGVTSVLDPEYQSDIAVQGSSLADKFSLKAIEEPLTKAVAELKAAKPDVMVLLSHCPLATTKKLIEQFPEFDVVLSAGGPEDPDPNPVKAEKPLLITVGHKGKSVGVVGYTPDAETKFQYELVGLDKWRFKDTPKMVEHMRSYQNRLKTEEVARTELPLPHPSGNSYVGAKKCGECHTKAYKFWKTTKHGHAFESLEHGGPAYTEGEKKGTFITRTFDAECLACHTTGWNPQEMLRYEGGYLPPEFAKDEAEKKHMALLQGQQCENCHGPGSRHTELDEQWAKDRSSVSEADVMAARKEVKLTVAIAKDKVCYRCHDTDNSPNFSSATFDQYWEKVKHPFRD